MDDERDVLLIPGPVTVDPAVLAALARPVRPHYGASWAEAYGRTCSSLAEVFRARGTVMLMFGPATAALEMAIASTLGPGDQIVIPASGRFARRLAELARAAGLSVVDVGVAPYEPVALDAFRDALDRPSTRPRLCARSPRDGGRSHQPHSGAEQGGERRRPAHDRRCGLLARRDRAGYGRLGRSTSASESQTSASAPRSGSRRSRSSERGWRAVDDGRPKAAGWYLNLATWRTAMAERAAAPTSDHDGNERRRRARRGRRRPPRQRARGGVRPATA